MGSQYSIFAKNLANEDYLHFLESEAYKVVQDAPFSYLLGEKWYQLTSYIPEFESDDQPCLQYKYMDEMFRLCSLYNVKFYVLCSPCKESNKERFLLLCDTIDTQNKGYLLNYSASLKTFSDDKFIDELHLKSQFVPKDYFNLLQ